MAELIPWQKPVPGEEPEQSVGNWRQDHPHFQDVQRTAYAKGVITDFKKVRDDPIEVAPMVKVEIEGYGESEDYIPLFFHPKPQYWDDGTVKATDFDQEQNYFKKAWQSFRCGDEVVVLMQANEDGLVPKYVVGFIDNYPRIGENVIRVEWNTMPGYEWEGDPFTSWFSYYYSFSNEKDGEPFTRFDNWEFAGDPDYGMNREYEAPIPLKVLCSLEEYKTAFDIPSTEYQTSENIYWDWRIIVPDPGDVPPCPICVGHAWNCHIPPCDPESEQRGHISVAVHIGVEKKYIYYYYDDIYYFRVGPILFAFVYHKRKTVNNYQPYMFYGQHECLEPWHEETFPCFDWDNPLETWGCPSTNPNGSYEFWYVPCGLSGNYYISYVNCTVSWDGEGLFPPVEDTITPYGYTVYAAICTPELWENPDISKMIKQDSYYAPWYNEWTNGDPQSYKFLVPPHSREALIETGKLNDDGTLPEETAA